MPVRRGGLLQQGLVPLTGEGPVLLGVGGAREGPEARAGAAAQDHGGCPWPSRWFLVFCWWYGEQPLPPLLISVYSSRSLATPIRVAWHAKVGDGWVMQLLHDY